MDSKQQISDWFLGELDRIEQKLDAGEEQIKKDNAEMSDMVDESIADLEATFVEARAKSVRRKENFAKSVAASNPDDDD